MHGISSRRLTHLVALAEEGSFARAAERVHLSQPALSLQADPQTPYFPELAPRAVDKVHPIADDPESRFRF
ncbi:helix-turn-helix domain-containing protein [Paraburkholderia sp. GAS334]|uniref:helix-turn-helix domain-containing protein n=1 Tax=Paraburkholderia sp. GAS334 TaxID=3035131 RepID=UPI003D221EDB